MKRTVVFLAMLIGSTALSRAQIAVSDSAAFKIESVNGGLYLGVSGGSQVAGASIVQGADDGTAKYLWHFIPMGYDNSRNPQYLIENLLTHQVIGVSNAAMTNGAQILQWADNGTNDHLWRVASTGQGSYWLYSENSGLVIEQKNGVADSTATIDQWSQNGYNCQWWKLINTGIAPYPAPAPVTGNGIYVHDPNMIQDAKGVYWLYGTHNTLAYSYDLIHFTSDGEALLPYAPWVGYYSRTDDLWAPDVVERNGQYYQYYAVSSFGSSTSAIGLATATSASSTAWADRGIVYSSNDGSSYNAIDPSPIQDAAGNWWMSFGSAWNGIYMIQLDPHTGKQSTANTTLYHLAQRPYWPYPVIEGSFLYHRGGYYYLFASVYNCCQGDNSTYHIVVGRSSTVNGTYLDRGGLDMQSAGGGAIVLSAHDNVNGPGGEGVIDDATGPLLYYHYYDGNNNGVPTLGINRMGFTTDGWPYLLSSPHVALSSSASASAYGNPITLTAKVTGSGPAPTGTVEFEDGNTRLGAGTLSASGVATLRTSAFSVGTHALTAVYSGDTNYNYAAAKATQVVNKAAPKIAWATPAPIAFGTPLSARQLDATATIAGAFSYTPPAGTVLKVGTQKLTVKFAPADTRDYTAATASVNIQVLPLTATPAFRPPQGTYKGAQSVTIQDNTKGAVIYYTTNGTTPTSNSTKFTKAIAVTRNITIKAIAVASGYANSAVATARYTIE